MIILGIRTDKPEAELLVYDGEQIRASVVWQAHRELSDTIFTKLEELLGQVSLRVEDITEIAVFAGPGSFTGLRIGHAVANALSYAQDIPVVATNNETWLQDATRKLQDLRGKQIVQPMYGSQAKTTKPRK